MSRLFESQIYLRETSGRSVEKEVLSLFKEPFMPKIEQNHKNLNILFHGPYSSPHFIKGDSNVENRPVFDKNGELLKIDGLSIEIPKVKEICATELSAEIGKYSELLDFDEEKLADFISKEEDIWGEYWPRQLGFKIGEHDGLSVNPRKFLAAFLLKCAYEKQEAELNSDFFVVLHTDALIFPAGLESQNISEYIADISKLISALNLKIVFENNQPPLNEAFQKSLFWTYDPIQMHDFLGEFPNNIGLCIDLKHMIESGFSTAEILGRIQELNEKEIPLVIHSRDKYVEEKGLDSVSGYREIMTYVFKEAIPVAYEPDLE